MHFCNFHKKFFQIFENLRRPGAPPPNSYEADPLSVPPEPKFWWRPDNLNNAMKISLPPDYICLMVSGILLVRKVHWVKGVSNFSKKFHRNFHGIFTCGKEILSPFSACQGIDHKLSDGCLIRCYPSWILLLLEKVAIGGYWSLPNFEVNLKYYKGPLMHEGFFGWGGPPSVWRDSLFEGRDNILLLGKALKFGVIFQKFALKLLKIWKIMEKLSEEKQNFQEKFRFFARAVGKIRIIIYLGYSCGSAAEPPPPRT